ncbi:MAG: hypothetical protein AYK18_15115 [Theionarchaea archaeon DG-70]|nr:MAG: hypothetical protein AYK18_15115 [Theionarchaea archaeon DG-70]
MYKVMKISAIINTAVRELPVRYQRVNQAMQNRNEPAPCELSSESNPKAKIVIKGIIMEAII